MVDTLVLGILSWIWNAPFCKASGSLLGGEEKVKARGEDGRVNHETAPTIKQG